MFQLSVVDSPLWTNAGLALRVTVGAADAKIGAVRTPNAIHDATNTILIYDTNYDTNLEYNELTTQAGLDLRLPSYK